MDGLEKLPVGRKKIPKELKKVPIPQIYLMPVDIELLGGRRNAYIMACDYFASEINKRKKN
jgi:hypothetical protein